MTDRVEPAEGATGVGGGAKGAERRSGSSRLQYDKATRSIVVVDPIAAAEREVIAAAKSWHNNSGKLETFILHGMVAQLLAGLRAAHAERKP